MANVLRLVQSLEAVHLGGIVEECVVHIKDNNAHIKAMDMTTTVYIQTDSPFDHEDAELGLGNLSLLIKYLKSYTSGDMEFTRKDNTLTIKPETGGTLKYLLSEVSLVPTYSEEWEEEGDPIEAAIENADCSITVNEESVKEFLKLMGLFKPNGVTISVTKRGKVTIQGGNETEHQFSVEWGSTEATIKEPIQVRLYGANITAVLSQLDFVDPITLYFVLGEIAIVTENTAWVIRPLTTESGGDE